MAKVAKSDNVNKTLLAEIVAGTVTFISQVDGLPMLQHVPPLIEVNPAMADPQDASKAACRATAEAAIYLAKHETKAEKLAEPSKYVLITGAVLPDAKKRGNQSGSGAPTKYPFEHMEVNQTFFSANSEHTKGDAVKALGSTVSSQNRKYATPIKDAAGVEQTKEVTRAVRDKKTHKALLNADGSKQTETVKLPVLEYSRKFTIRPVEAGKVYGTWTAPEAGALIARTK